MWAHIGFWFDTLWHRVVIVVITMLSSDGSNNGGYGDLCLTHALNPRWYHLRFCFSPLANYYTKTPETTLNSFNPDEQLLIWDRTDPEATLTHQSKDGSLNLRIESLMLHNCHINHAWMNCARHLRVSWHRVRSIVRIMKHTNDMTCFFTVLTSRVGPVGALARKF